MKELILKMRLLRVMEGEFQAESAEDSGWTKITDSLFPMLKLSQLMMILLVVWVTVKEEPEVSIEPVPEAMVPPCGRA